MTRRDQSPSAGCVVDQLRLSFWSLDLEDGDWLISPLYEEMTSLKLILKNRNELEEADNRLGVSVCVISCGLLDAHAV